MRIEDRPSARLRTCTIWIGTRRALLEVAANRRRRTRAADQPTNAGLKLHRVQYRAIHGGDFPRTRALGTLDRVREIANAAALDGHSLGTC